MRKKKKNEFEIVLARVRPSIRIARVAQCEKKKKEKRKGDVKQLCIKNKNKKHTASTPDSFLNPHLPCNGLFE